MTKTILLAEDSADDADILQLRLRDLGIVNPVVVVRDGHEAISYLEGEGHFADREKFPFPSVLFLDLNMPGVDGFDVLEWIARRGGLDDTLVVVLSGLHAVREVKHAYSLGADSFLCKPGTPSELNNLRESFPSYWLCKPLPPGHNGIFRDSPAVD